MLAYLQLLRLPTVFTAMADIVLGYVLTHRFLYGPFAATEPGLPTTVGWHDPGHFFGLLIASCCLYLSGMVFNDLFDQRQDLEERPGRPIPSGRVTARSAAILGLVLMVSGIAAASMVSRTSLQVALVLAMAILAYDRILKRTWLGPVAMGSCRFLNVLLGASAQEGGLPSLLAQPQFAAALGLGIYIVGVTIFARTEAKVSSRIQLLLAGMTMNVGFGILGWLIFIGQIDSPFPVPLAMLVVIAFTINRRIATAIGNPVPATVQGSIKVMLLSLVMLDATLVFWWLNTPDSGHFGTIHALGTAVLVIPAMLISRLIPMT